MSLVRRPQAGGPSCYSFLTSHPVRFIDNLYTYLVFLCRNRLFFSAVDHVKVDSSLSSYDKILG